MLIFKTYCAKPSTAPLWTESRPQVVSMQFLFWRIPGNATCPEIEQSISSQGCAGVRWLFSKKGMCFTRKSQGHRLGGFHEKDSKQKGHFFPGKPQF